MYVHYGNLLKEESVDNLRLPRLNVCCFDTASLTVNTALLRRQQYQSSVYSCIDASQIVFSVCPQTLSSIEPVAVQITRGCECSGTVLALGEHTEYCLLIIASLFQCMYQWILGGILTPDFELHSIDRLPVCVSNANIELAKLSSIRCWDSQCTVQVALLVSSVLGYNICG